MLFRSGLWYYDGSSWTDIKPTSPASDTYGAIDGIEDSIWVVGRDATSSHAGAWYRRGSSWTWYDFNSLTPNNTIIYDVSSYGEVDFGNTMPIIGCVPTPQEFTEGKRQLFYVLNRGRNTGGGQTYVYWKSYGVADPTGAYYPVPNPGGVPFSQLTDIISSAILRT